ncbi:MAG: adenylate/guanylate cyclase domain-containing protein [Proteobacteria bacterium]|nr:MAG: adenylate/guanylate cyclase domain-containing protein [Pseudomonadota bacterium]
MKKKLSRWAQRFGLGRAIGLLLLFVFLGIRYWDPAPLQELRLRSFDLYQVMLPRVTPERPVTIVDIDEQSLRTYGQWPWARTRVADLINRLTAMQAAVIAFDVVFAEPDRLSPAVAADSFRGLDEATRATLRSLPSNDDVLADALRKSRVVLGQSGVSAPIDQGDLSGIPRTTMAWRPPDPAPWLVTFPHLLVNTPTLEKAAAGRGLFSIVPERDGIVRRVPVVMQAGGQIVPALSLEVLRVGFGAQAIRVITNQAGVEEVQTIPPRFKLPTDRNGKLWVHFSEPERDIYVSAKDVLEGRVAPERIAGKIVVIGTSAIGLLDIKTTPVDPSMPGVEIHAQLIEAVLTGSILTYPFYAKLVEMLAAFLVGVAIIIFAPAIGALPLLILGAGVGAGLAFISWTLFQSENTLIDVTFPLMSSFGVYAALVFVNYVREQAGRQRIRSAFGQYLSPTLVEQLAQNPDKLVLGGEERTMTILFSDVRGFTTISESFKDDPQGLTNLMNRLLTPTSNAIQGRNGTIDKYMGDAIMAFWNAPIDDPNHELNACEAALDMLERLDELNAERKQEAEAGGKPFIPIKIGIGINTGRVTVGNMGSDMRFQYTVLGDAVNLASRIEGQTKSYGVPILIGARTAEAVKDKLAVVEIDFITVKGKTEPEVVYTVVGRKELVASSEFEGARTSMHQLLARYRAQDWAGAIAAARACRAVNGLFHLDGVADLYEERIAAFERDPPPPDWNGVFALQTK